MNLSTGCVVITAMLSDLQMQHGACDWACNAVTF